MKRRTLTLLAVVAALLLVGGVAAASIPDASGVIHGCRKTSNGDLTVIDSATQTCPAGTVALNWSQTGPQGPAGPTGPAGPAGPTPVARTVTDEMAVTANQGPAAGRSLGCASNETAFSPVAVQYDTTGQFLPGFAIEWVAQPDFGTGQVTGTAGPYGYFIQAEAGPADGLIRFYVTCVAGVAR